MFVPVIHTIVQHLGEFIESFETTTFQGQGTQLFPPQLDQVQRRLDKAVLDAHGWPHKISDEKILEWLLKMNFERAQENDTEKAKKKSN